MIEDRKKIHKNFAHIWYESNITQKELADHLDMTRENVSRWVRRNKKENETIPPVKYWKKIADKFEMTYEDFHNELLK